MRTLNEELEAVKDDDTIIGAKPPKVRTLFDVVKTGNYSLEDFKKSKELVAPEYESDISTRIRAGISRGYQDIKNVPQNVEIFTGQVEMAIGGWAGKEDMVERGRSLIKTAKGELEAKEKAFYQSAIPMSAKDYESISYGVGQGLVNYGAMLAAGYLGGEVAGLASMAVLEGGQKAQEKIDYYTEKTGDLELKGYTPQQAGKDAALSAIYEAGSTILEKKLGYGAQRKLFKVPLGKKIRTVGLTALSEGGTETIQELYAIGIDLAGGYIDTSKLPERFIRAVKEGVIGGILGGTAGIAAAVNHRSQAKAILRDSLKNTVPSQDLDNVVDAIYESTSDSMANIITQELAQSEQLRNKHGEIYNSLKEQIWKQIRDVGAHKGVDETKLAMFVEGTASTEADRVLAEANKRGVLIDDVRKATDIVYRDGRLYLEGVSEKTKIKRAREKAKQTPSLLQFIRTRGGVIDESGELRDMDAAKSFIGLVNKNGMSLDSMGEALWEAGYFQERPTKSELLEVIDDELRGRKHYPFGDIRAKAVTEVENEAMLDDALYEYADIMGYDLNNMSYDEKAQAYEQMQRNLNASDEMVYDEPDTPSAAVEDIFDLSYFQVADENAEFDAMYPAYEGETININGQEKTVYNSNGDRIAKSKEALENFYKWFGDSKVVDKEGRPLVMYHGTSKKFDTFDKSKIGKKHKDLYQGKGFYFTSEYYGAQNYGRIIMPVYLRIEKPALSDYNLKPENDGIYAGHGAYVVFEPNQIKSTKNKGQFNAENENIYYQEDEYRAEYEQMEALEEELERWRESLEKSKENPYNLPESTVKYNIDFDKRQIARVKKQIRELEDSLKEPLAEKLYATHNMSLAGVKGALKLGGMAMPSLAMRRVSQGNINQFGDIVFVADKNMASPSRKTTVFDRDAWTPSIAMQMKYDLSQKGKDYIRDVLKKHGQGDRATVFFYNINDKLDDPKNNSMALELYALEKGVEFKWEAAESQDYLDWYEKNIEDNAIPYLFTENDANTDMVAKKFTLPNIMKILKKQDASGGGFLGDSVWDLSHTLQFLAKDLRTMKDVRANKDRIVTREKQSEYLDKLNNDFWELAEELKKDGVDYDYGGARQALAVVLVNGKSKVKEHLEAKKLDSSDAAVKKVEKLIEDMENALTDYFEVKPRRVVNFDEFAGVVVPNGKQYDEVAEQLKDRGLRVERVEKGNAEQYKDAMMSIYKENPSVFFQTEEGEEADRNLVAIHSLSERSLEKALDLGGFAVPSIAIINKNEDFRFGNMPITLVANKDMIDPARAENEVYNRDVWSKTFPFKEYKKPTAARVKKFKAKYEEYFEKTASKNQLGSFIYEAERGLNSDAFREFKDSSGMMMYFLEKVKGEDIKLEKKDRSAKMLEEADIDEQFASEVKDIRDAYEKGNEEKIVGAINNLIERGAAEFEGEKFYDAYKKHLVSLYFNEDGSLRKNKAQNVLDAVWRYYQTKGTESLDYYEVKEQLRKEIEKYPDYNDWAEQVWEKDLVGEPMVSVGKTLKPYTLENIVDSMIHGATVNAQDSLVYGSGKVIAAGARQLADIEDIRIEGKKLVSREEQKQAMEDIEAEMSAFADELVTSSDIYGSMIQREDAYVVLGKLAKKDNPTKSDVQKALNYEYGNNKKYSDELLEAGVKIAKDARNISRHYFEAKPQRAVGIGEWSAAIMPTSSEFDAIAKKAEGKGLKVIRSDDQVQALRDLDAEKKVFFQVNNMPKQPKKIKGAFDALTKSIEITSEADFSTYQHEFGHYWIDNIWNYVKSGKASAAYVKQFNELAKWLGVKPDQEYLTRAQHEKFARAHEKWLYKGDIPNPIVGEFFKGYDSFIREVYSSIAEIDTRAGVKYKPLPKLVYDFFNSMVTGELPYYGGGDDKEYAKETVEKQNVEAKEFAKEQEKTLVESIKDYRLKPVQTDTEKGYLTAYKKMTGEEVEAGSVKLEEELAKAEKFVSENPELAQQIVNGTAPVPEGMLKNTIYLAYDKLQKRIGNTANRVNSLMNQALELRRMGQEISSQRLAYQTETAPLYWIQKIQNDKVTSLADANRMQVKQLNDLISKSIRDGMKQGKTAKEIAASLREQLGVTKLYQEEVYPTEETDQNSYNYIYKYVNEQLGLGMTMEEAETITRKADDLLASLENSMAKDGNPSVDYFVKQKDLENYANSIAPSSEARVAVSVIGRGNLLFSIKSPLTNVVSNTFVGLYRAAVRRIMLKTSNSIVDPELIKQNMKYSWEVFRKTGYNVNNITPETPRNTILGEKLTHSEGEGKIRWLGRFYDNLIYKWSLGAGDVIFKDFAFTDYVALRATKESRGDVAKANEIFKDASLIEPQTELGQEIRTEAIQESLISTYQNNGLISEKALKARSAMDFGVGFGEFIAPFVKTPANVVSMGLKAGFGSLRAVVSEIARDVRAGKIQTPTKKNIDLVVQNGLGLLTAWMLLGLIDDDDYMPPYALATNKDKQMAKELNISYNAIRIGNTWMSLDYLGPLASPIVGLLQARREKGVLNSIFGYTKSGAIQSLSIPAFGNIADIFTNIQNMVRKDGVDVAAETLSDALQAVYARTVPSIVSDVAKMLDPYDRETRGHEIKAKVPFVRETLPEKVNVTTGKAENLDSPIMELLFGARGKTQVSNAIASEIQRLNAAGYGVSLTPVTQRGLLSGLDEKTKDKVRHDFAKKYSQKVGQLIASGGYKRLDDEDKQQKIDKIRRNIVEDLKKAYLKKKKQ